MIPWRSHGHFGLHVVATSERQRERQQSDVRRCGLVGSLHESFHFQSFSVIFSHECLKSLLAFRKPAVAAASRRPARADGPKVGLDGPASLGAGRAPWRAGQARARLALRQRRKGNVCRGG